jgi:hypothetical protein
MQTFVPFTDIKQSASVIDNRRLNKQLLEGVQIYRILATNKTKGGWVRHPAVLMWKNYDTGLYSYLSAIRDECDLRGIKWQNNWQTLQNLHDNNWHRGDNAVMPPWWNDERVHQSHRNNLYRKDPEFYAEFMHDGFVSCCDKCSYWWPTHTKQYSDTFTGYF